MLSLLQLNLLCASVHMQMKMPYGSQGVMSVHPHACSLQQSGEFEPDLENWFVRTRDLTV